MEIKDIKIQYKCVGQSPHSIISTAEKAVSYMQKAFDTRPLQEQLFVILLNTQLRAIGRHLVAIGSVNSCVCNPADIFRSAILAGASSFITIHNHPSGSSKPSEEDLQMAQQLQKVGEMMHITMSDFLIIAEREGVKDHWSYIQQSRGFK